MRIRLEGTAAELDAHEAALRQVLTITEPASRNYPNRNGSDCRRYLESTGVKPAPDRKDH
ncbi:hypothetical protein JNW90_10650 [Micromonospora sp. STR1s_5]|nr:hypothetical protein [Micromonospora sp. STR1s_5]